MIVLIQQVSNEVGLGLITKGDKMGVNTKGFIHNDNAKNFTWIDIIRYIDAKYGVTYIQPCDRNFMTISFNDGEDKRNLSVFDKYTTYKNEGYPEFENKNAVTIMPTRANPYIVLFDVNCWGNSADIIKGIVQNFGGGYFIHNDCNDDWEII